MAYVDSYAISNVNFPLCTLKRNPLVFCDSVFLFPLSSTYLRVAWHLVQSYYRCLSFRTTQITCMDLFLISLMDWINPLLLNQLSTSTCFSPMFNGSFDHLNPIGDFVYLTLFLSLIPNRAMVAVLSILFFSVLRF